MLNPIKEIVRFNKQAGLLDKPYEDFLESSFLIEEALEGLNLHKFSRFDEDYGTHLASPSGSAKDISRNIVSIATEGFLDISDVDRLDKACDAVVYAVGSMAKLGLNAQQITQALNIVMRANFAKLGGPVDEFGKQLKPEGWTGPEAELQALLDSIK